MKLTEIQEKWLAALESGAYGQTKNILFDGVDYCCLGVAAHVAGIVEEDAGAGCFVYPGDTPVEEAMYELLDEKHIGILGLRGESGELKNPVIIEKDYRVYDEAQNEFVLKREPYAVGALADLNDNGWTFAQIAGFIRAYPEEVFVESEV